ncbi:MAG: tripartite tricarboxylate transporter substrate binding protein [Alcaligenaceae bacterium]|nr:tripartite tricarboxylate transporter substrate binding protein [Alcaligenaceae bacterium SAGV5]MPS50506.1 tripartite tricarboxylate transporter substrate binding protein [Alcaligenaceae bacterium SAGV3]MPT58335.1 tripartite tricarboxylate transporter substrate binding protein [Alcaligenaceae bacterium]
MGMKTKWRSFAGVLLSLAVTGAAQAAWPERAITLVVPFAAGGNTDSIARITAEWLTAKLKQTVVVDNRPGANGAIAADYVARAKPDGYTLFMATAPQMAIVPYLQKVRYDPIKDFAPVSIVATNEFALAVHPSFAAKTLPELVSYVKAHPGQVAYASAGSGSVSHLTMAMFVKRAELSMIHAPYRGGAPAIADVVGGQVPMYFANVAEVLPYSTTNRLRIVATSGTRPSNDLPGVKTVAEQGYPGFTTETWNGVAAPAGTPAGIVDKIAGSLAEAGRNAEFGAKLAAIGVSVLCNTPEEFARKLVADNKLWSAAVKESGASLD